MAVILLGGPIVRGRCGLIKRELNVDELVSIALIASLAIVNIDRRPLYHLSWLPVL